LYVEPAFGEIEGESIKSPVRDSSGDSVVSWLQRYRIRYFIRNSTVVLPVLGIAAAIVTAWLVHRIEQPLGLESPYSAEAMRTVIGILAGSMFTFVVFLCSALLVAVQLASGQLTPRIIGFIFRDPVTKVSLTIFVYTFTLSLASLIRIESTVPLVTSKLAVWGCVASLCTFFYLIDHVGKVLRPSGILKTMGSVGREVIHSVYPKALSRPQGTPPDVEEILRLEPVLTINNPKDGVVLAFDMQGLVRLARSADCAIHLMPQVGDFVAAEVPLFEIHHGGEGLPRAALCRCIALGQERTVEQDPTLAFRIIVDIAAKGLSPAINDPTTAVLAIDQIHYLLRKVGGRQLDDGVIRDEEGQVRLIYRTPNWEDFVKLAVTEIRQFGASSIQIARRLRAMLESLIEALPEERTEILREELSLLKRTAERAFREPEDLALAAEADSQGMGGSAKWRGKHEQLRPVPIRPDTISSPESRTVGSERKAG
jgi:uncharacterized membrane protein